MRWLRTMFQRLLVFALGAITVWLIVFVLFDFADQRLPWFIALACTYAVAAYVVLPRAIRLGLRILKRGRVPSYTITGDGLPGDPVNLVLVGTRQELRAAFAAAGWFEADTLGLKSSWRMVVSFVLDRPYPTAPFSTLYLFGRGQDLGFQLPIGGSPRKRHHVRFWGQGADRLDADLGTAAFWLDEPPPPEGERVLWIGAATKDTGFSLTHLSFQITHATDADTNAERDFVMGELAGKGLIGKVRYHLAGERLSVGKVNRYITDSELAVADIVCAPATDGSR